ncbi:hypothetical protein [Streptomyces sp. NPDC001530]|uniref:hypothetical protein n=1 Tax=Streptomyces sp. NPDC001530 TaxID=3364582 RepID=UPI0036AE0E41
MRALVSRPRGLLLPPMVCAALICGPVGTAAAAVDVPRETSVGADTEWPFTESDGLLDQLGILDGADLEDALAPLLDVLSDLAGEDLDHLDAAGAVAYATALETANASAQRQLKDRAPAVSGGTNRAGVPLADPVSDLGDQLQSTVDDLVKALTGALGSVTGLLSPVLDVVTGLLGGAQSAVPSLPTMEGPAAASA